MTPRVNLSQLTTRRDPATLVNNRQKSLDAVQRFKDAQANLERVCEEKGIQVPVMVC